MMMKKAFTLLELIFVIVIISILGTVAIPKFSATRDDAVITKAKAVLASVRSSIALERQRRVLMGDYTEITDLGNLFTEFNADGNKVKKRVLDYPVNSCQGKEQTGCWEKSNKAYIFRNPIGKNCNFKLIDSRLVAVGSCDILER